MSHTIKTGDPLLLKMRLIDETTGQPLDLTGATVRVVVSSAPGAVPISDGTASIVDPATDGRFDYASREGETVRSGPFHVEATASRPDGWQVTNKGYGLVYIERRLA